MFSEKAPREWKIDPPKNEPDPAETVLQYAACSPWNGDGFGCCPWSPRQSSRELSSCASRFVLEADL
jgi:hypothetical protein